MTPISYKRRSVVTNSRRRRAQTAGTETGTEPEPTSGNRKLRVRTFQAHVLRLGRVSA